MQKSQVIGNAPCEICEVDVRCLKFPGLHVLCVPCSKRVNDLLKPELDRIIEELKRDRP